MLDDHAVKILLFALTDLQKLLILLSRGGNAKSKYTNQYLKMTPK